MELDDAYLGGPKHNGKRGRGTTKRKMVVGLSLEDGKPRFLRLELVNDLKNETLTEFSNSHLEAGTQISSDGYKSYQKLGDFSATQQNFTPTSDHLKWPHKAISNLKAFLLGTYHGRCTNFQDYLNEYACLYIIISL